MSKYVILVIGADGSTDIIGPYTSERRVREDAARIDNPAESVSAEAHLLDSPANVREYIA